MGGSLVFELSVISVPFYFKIFCKGVYPCYTETGSVSRSLYHLDVTILELIKLSLSKKINTKDMDTNVSISMSMLH